MRRLRITSTAGGVTLHEHMVLVQLDAASCHQKAVDTVAGSGEPQAAALDRQVKTPAGIDQAALGGQEGVGAIAGVMVLLRRLGLYCRRIRAISAYTPNHQPERCNRIKQLLFCKFRFWL